MQEREIVKDLFGHHVALPSGGGSGRRGRPAHSWSLEVENKVKLGLAMGFGDDKIAKSIGVSVPTLRKYYFSALKQREIMRDAYELNRAAVLQDLANGGNVQASKELDKVFGKMDRVRARQAAADAEPHLGKKAERLARAKDRDAAGDDPFSPGYGGSGPH